ncbi:olee1-like protein [Vigna unguiculata]|uniref:Pollen allergen Ole e 1 family n=1 Tax=Vigna unguiculata TaxID=3917 RepID=A0A4D6LLU0_VIGUN|nr:olee1-like protein [Vigna unguiculata]QCD89473.1 Pollen allergen Ole e 1 family [Vigna unguiculata]
MARSFVVVVLFVSVLCFSSTLARKISEKFYVEGKIYCDPCHFAFESRLSFPLSGVNVTLECINEQNNTMTYKKDSTTDANGLYRIPVRGDHQDDICVVVAKSPNEGECQEAMPNKSDRIILTNNMGAASRERFVNPLGFMTETIDSQCNIVVQELGLDNRDD